MFRDGEAWFSWCSNPGCQRHRDQDEAGAAVYTKVFDPDFECDFTTQALSDAFPDPEARVCTCTSAAMCCVAARFSDLLPDGDVEAAPGAESDLPPAVGEANFTDVVDELGDIGAALVQHTLSYHVALEPG